MINKKYLDTNTILDTGDIIELILQNESSQDLARLERLEKYYKVQNTTILNRQMSNNKDNNRIASAYCRYITNTVTGYFMNGDCVSYTFPDGFDDKDVVSLFRYNDEPAVNNRIAENMSIFGYAIEQIYLDRNGKFRFASINPKNVIVLFNDNIDEDIHSVIKYRGIYLEDKDITRYYVDYYTPQQVTSYIFEDAILIPESEEVMINPFGDTPFIFYTNSNSMGDFEPVISIIDAYDKAVSNMSNLMDYFNDALI